ncbi:MAG TPA: DUF1015 domain-containing protein [Candidatus Binatia bacterium]|nr:DUF1015 domain-containing protein [Candidatus Binatia bacterium]
MPVIKPFRALRYEPDAVGDVALVTSPPYDVIGEEEHRSLLARHPKNVVRLDLPADELGDDPDERYRRAARTFAAWRSDGTFHKDPRPSLYVYEQTYTVPGSDVRRTQRGFFARLRLEAPGSGGVLPHEATLSAPREDRYKLLRATGANMSPIVGLHGDPSGEVAAILASVAGGSSGPPVADIVDGDETRHRMWVVPDVPASGAAPETGHAGSTAGDQTSADAHAAESATVALAAPPRSLVGELVALASAGPVTIADGHHRYETALRYRDERRMSRACEEDPAFDYVLALLLATSGEELTVLPTHRIVHGLGQDGVAALLAGLDELFDRHRVERRETLEAEFGSEAEALDSRSGGRGRFGLWTRDGGAVLTARRPAFEASLPAGSDALRRLDVTLLQVALGRLAGIDEAATAAGRITYTKSIGEALDAVDLARGGSDVAFLLEGTPVRDIVAVAEAGDLMPQKSTYFYPKPLSGLVINPHEW